MKEKNQRIKTVISWMLVIGWLGIIFGFSAQNSVESSELSEGIVSYVAKAQNLIAPSYNFDIDQLNSLIRNCAHFFIYFVLGVFVVNAIVVTGKKIAYITLPLCMLYALSDEFHQYFVPGRVFSLIDIGIDTFGALLGICLFIIIKRLTVNKITNRN